ncbi:MAG: hypothetical protein DRO01_05600 [Thermoproteota archaeon]|nr:MAG: hypothetical protein DRO01_05600 [Candidatus Korarchaeota archaeon]
MLARKALSVLCAALGIAYLAQDLALAFSVEVAPVWLILENVFFAFAYVSLGTFRALKRPELPLSAVAGFNAGRMVDTILNASEPANLRAIRAALALLALAVVGLSWASILSAGDGRRERQGELGRDGAGERAIREMKGASGVEDAPAARRPALAGSRRRNLKDLSARRSRRPRGELNP